MKKVPKIFVNNLSKINNNKEVFYSYKDNDFEYEKEEIIIPNEYEMQQKINKLFRSNDFIYKKKFNIKTINGEGTYTVISKSYDYLLTIDGEKIWFKNIINIEEA